MPSKLALISSLGPMLEQPAPWAPTPLSTRLEAGGSILLLSLNHQAAQCHTTYFGLLNGQRLHCSRYFWDRSILSQSFSLHPPSNDGHLYSVFHTVMVYKSCSNSIDSKHLPIFPYIHVYINTQLCVLESLCCNVMFVIRWHYQNLLT